MDEAFAAARSAGENGNPPFGSALVVDEEVVATAENTTVTEGDPTAHPEFKLARWAASELDAAERERCVMYTSTEPCAMCASAIYYVGLDRVAYSVSQPAFAEATDRDGIELRCATVFERAFGPAPAADGPIREGEGLEIHRRFG